MPDESVTIRLRAAIDQFQKDLLAAGQRFDGFAKGITNAITPAGALIGTAIALGVGKAVQAIGHGIQEFAKFERALDQLGRKIESSGESWSQLRGAVTAYLQQIQETTRFSDDQAIGALDALLLKTNDFRLSMQLLERAMNLSVLANMDLKEAASMLALAYEGNQRGLMQLARTLGITGAQAKNAAFVFAELDRRSSNLARSESNVATELDKMKNAWADFSKQLGAVFGPGLVTVGRVLSSVVLVPLKLVIGAIDVLRTMLGGLAATVAVVAKAVVSMDFSTLGEELDAVNEGFNEQMEAIFGVGEEADQTAKKLEDLVKIASAPLRPPEAAAQTKKTLDSEQELFNAALGRQKSLFGALFTTLSSERTTLIQAEGETNELFAERVREVTERTKLAAQSTADAVKQFAGQMATDISSSVQTWLTAVKAGTAKASDAFKVMAQAILRAVVRGLGQALIQEGAAYTAKAIASLISVVEAAKAPGYFAAGASLAGAGGGIMAAAEFIKLAQGGVTTGPTLAMVGDNPGGREAIIPLNEAGLGGMLGSITFGQVTMSFPGVTREEDLRGARFAETAERKLATVLQDLRSRTGVRT